jgi:phage shock protein C
MSYFFNSLSLYRSRRGLLFGVCRGVAERFDLSVFWTRTITFIAFVLTGFWPVGVVYLLAALLLKREPGPWTTSRREGVMEGCREAVRSCRKAADSLEARLQRMERATTPHADDWDARLNGTP